MRELTDIDVIRDVLGRHGFHFSKSKGQNFLTAAWVPEEIVDRAGLDENTGVLELSKVHDPRVIRIAAAFAIAISFIPKLSELIGTMPSSIIGGVSFMLYGMISAIGVRNIVENKVDLTKSRNLIIAAVIFVCGLGFSEGITFHVGGATVTLTALARMERSE